MRGFPTKQLFKHNDLGDKPVLIRHYNVPSLHSNHFKILSFKRAQRNYKSFEIDISDYLNPHYVLITNSAAITVLNVPLKKNCIV